MENLLKTFAQVSHKSLEKAVKDGKTTSSGAYKILGICRQLTEYGSTPAEYTNPAVRACQDEKLYVQIVPGSAGLLRALERRVAT